MELSHKIALAIGAALAVALFAAVFAVCAQYTPCKAGEYNLHITYDVNGNEHYWQTPCEIIKQ